MNFVVGVVVLSFGAGALAGLMFLLEVLIKSLFEYRYYACYALFIALGLAVSSWVGEGVLESRRRSVGTKRAN